jgi:hypothetical protein
MRPTHNSRNRGSAPLRAPAAIVSGTGAMSRAVLTAAITSRGRCYNEGTKLAARRARVQQHRRSVDAAVFH